jgi:hypothetical protein
MVFVIGHHEGAPTAVALLLAAIGCAVMRRIARKGVRTLAREHPSDRPAIRGQRAPDRKRSRRNVSSGLAGIGMAWLDVSLPPC